MARWAGALPRIYAVLLVCVALIEVSNALEVIAKRKPAPAPTRNRSPRIPASSNVKKAVLSLEDRSDAGSLGRRALKDIESVFYSRLSYNVLVKIGEIEFLLALDTGSSDLWVVTDQCQSQECRDIPVYPSKSYKSPSFVSVNNNQTTFNISFADQTRADGFVARETFKLGNVQNAEQAIGMVTSTNLTLGQSVSGILGMGFPRLSRIAGSIPNAPPFLNTLSQLGQLEYPLFGLSLTYDMSGTLSMGAIDKTIVTNTSLISWHDVVPFLPLPGDNVTDTSLYLHWSIPLSGVAVNGSQSDITYTEIPLHATYANLTGEQPLALFDVGFNGISGPFEDVAAIFNALRSVRQVTTGTWAIPCDTQATMTFTFGSTNVTLQPSDYLIGPTQGDPRLCLSWPIASPPNADGLDWHFGSPFFRAAYTVFSYGVAGQEPPLIGLYPLSNSSALKTTPQEVSSLFSSLSATIPTTAPAVLLPTPTFTTPAYIFNTSVTPAPTVGQVVPTQTDAGSGNYTTLFRQLASGTAKLTNASALPVLDAPAEISTVLLTDSLGVVHTTTSTVPVTIPTSALGRPPGSFSLNGAVGRSGSAGVSLLLSSLVSVSVVASWTIRI